MDRYDDNFNEYEHHSRRSRRVDASTNSSNDNNSNNNNKKKKKKYRLNKKKFFIFILVVFLLICLAGVAYAGSIVWKVPKIDPDNIYSMLSESSILYDEDGKVIENVFSDKNRTNVEYNKISKHMINAIVSLEDKTFWEHHGFNFIRIFGAIKDAFTSGDGIGGTSTLTQQLARNVYLPDEMSDRTIKRKIAEAYYSVVLEKALTKEEIVEAYLNTIFLGWGNYGVEAASQAYFSKSAEDLNLAESAAIAALPQGPTAYAFVEAVPSESVSKKDSNILKRTSEWTYVCNDAAKERRELCLYLMKDQGKITAEEYNEAIAIPLKELLNPNFDATNTNSSYFTDYVIEEVTQDLMQEFGYTYDEAFNKVHNGGYRIHTTMDRKAQQVVEKEFDNPSNFPSVVGIRKDGVGNIISESGNVMLYDYNNYFNDDNIFTFKSNEISKNSDGSMTIKDGKRLNIYNTEVHGKTDYSLEFKNLYLVEDGKFYAVNGGYIKIPAEFKSRNNDGDIVISSDFFNESNYPNFFIKNPDGTYSLDSSSYTLSQKVIQPQGAMVISDNATGHIKAMIGGRETSGRFLYNRATETRQPGSSIKPLGVYGAALQKSFDAVANGESKLTYTSVGKQGTKMYGNYLTAASLIDDEPTIFEGRLWPKNSYNAYYGIYTMRRAMQQSVNVCAVKIQQQVGAEYSSNLIKKFGISTLVTTGSNNDMNSSSLALGGMTSGVTPLEMANAYTAFPNGGINHESSSYTKVVNKQGDVIIKSKSLETKVLDPGVAFIMTDMLKSVVSQGLGSPARLSGVQSGGKTGTTSNQFDIWFDGFTPSYSAAIWIGNDVNIQLSSYSNTAATLWGKIMNQIPKAKVGSYKGAPSNVIRGTAYGPSGSYSEYFTKGTQVNAGFKINGSAVICSESGYLATPDCPNTRSLTGLLRPYMPSKKVGDYKRELPHYYCNIHNSNPGAYPIDPDKKLEVPDIPVEPVDPVDPSVPTDPDEPGTDVPIDPEPSEPIEPEPSEPDTNK